MIKINLIFFFCVFYFCFIAAQNPMEQDSLQGLNHKYRNWWNVLHYNLTIEPNLQEKSIQGTVVISFEKIKETTDHKLQIDLQEPMKIDSFKAYITNTPNKTEFIEIKNNQIEKNKGFYLVDFTDHKSIFENTARIELKIAFSGKPKEAKLPPWQGGWVFDKDKKGNPFVSVACQIEGASLWFPTKDYWGDEPDLGAKLTIIVPNNWIAIGNGRRIETKPINKNKTMYSWSVTNPINGYNIIPYIGDFINFSAQYEGKEGTLDLDYWVLKENISEAKKQFTQVPEILTCFEEWLGPYPFYKDSYKLVEAPYLGMEHQSNIAYGNKYKNGYLGYDLSESGWGLDWDYILVHESGHEWFGNAISAKEPADMWIHEAFATYTEILFTECQTGQKASNAYAKGLRKGIKHDHPMMGEYGLNKEGSMDMYKKGANMIHTLRQIINDDNQFKFILHSLIADFKNQTIQTKDVINKINSITGKDFTPFFYQFLKTTEIPRLLIKKNKKQISYKWDDLQQFPQNIPLKFNNQEWIYPQSDEWKIIKLKRNDKFAIDQNFYVEIKEIK